MESWPYNIIECTLAYSYIYDLTPETGHLERPLMLDGINPPQKASLPPNTH